MKLNKVALVVFVLGYVLASPCNSLGQSHSVDSARQLKNTVRFNLSGLILFSGGYTVIGYERVVKPNQSFSVNFGVARLPKFRAISTDIFNLKHDVQNKGYNLSVD